MNASSLGINDGWSGLTAPKEFVNKFEVSARNSNNEPTAWKDKRAMFHTDGQTYENTEYVKDFTKAGYAITKFKNKPLQEPQVKTLKRNSPTLIYRSSA